MVTYSAYTPQNAISLARLSDVDPDPVTGELPTDGVDYQVHTHYEWATAHGWRIGREIKSPKLSGYRRKRVAVNPDGTETWRVWRPDLQLALRLLWTGQHDGLIVTDLDRYGRDPYDLEDLITLVEQRRGRLHVASLTGSLKLDSDADIAQARVQMAFARKSSQDTARRVSAARRRLALAGKHGGGPRPYGYGADGVTLRPAEAAEIVKAADMLLAGVGLRAITNDLRRRQVPSTTGGRWEENIMRDVLLRPRNAGLMVNNGAVVEGVVAPWPAIIPEDRWRAVVAVLKDPSRRTTPGPEPRWLGSGTYLCGSCGNVCHVMDRRYRCKRSTRGNETSGHVMRLVTDTDPLVVAVLLERLRRPDAAALLAVRPDAGIDAVALRARKAELRAKADGYVGLNLDGTMTDAQLAHGLKVVNAETAKIDAVLASHTDDQLLRPLIDATDVEAVWEALPLGAQREVVRKVLRVTIMPMGSGRWGAEAKRRALRVEPAAGS